MPEDKKTEIALTPKARLLQDTDLVTKLGEITRSPEFINASNAMLAEMVWDGSSSEKLEGAKTFIRLMVNITEAPKNPKPLPTHPLTEI